MYQSWFSCWHMPQTRGRLSLEPWTGRVSSLSNPETAVSYSRTLDRRCRFTLKPWTGGVRSLSNAGPTVSVLSRTLIGSQVVLDSLTLLLIGARSSRLNLTSDTK